MNTATTRRLGTIRTVLLALLVTGVITLAIAVGAADSPRAVAQQPLPAPTSSGHPYAPMSGDFAWLPYV